MHGQHTLVTIEGDGWLVKSDLSLDEIVPMREMSLCLLPSPKRA
jgi:hypothetical protein